LAPLAKTFTSSSFEKFATIILYKLHLHANIVPNGLLAAFACLSDYYKGAYVVKASFIVSAKIPPHYLSPANSAGFYRSRNHNLQDF